MSDALQPIDDPGVDDVAIARRRLYGSYGSFRAERSHESVDGPPVNRTPGARRTYRQLSAVLEPLDRASVILEIGCGEGAFLDQLRSRGFVSARGVDVAPDMVDIARAAGLDVELSDATQRLDSQEAALDMVVAIDVIEHLTAGEQVRLLERVHAALRPGGTLVVKTANGRGLFSRQVIYGDFTHEHVLSPESLRQVLTSVGFSQAHFEEVLPGPGDTLWRCRRVLWWLIVLAVRVVRLIETGKRQRIWTENFLGIATKQG